MAVARLASDDPKWLEWLASRPDATPFHHPAWLRVVAGSYGYPSFVLALTDEHGAIRAGMPIVEISRPLLGKRWVSLPFTDWSPPVMDDGVSAAELLTHVDEARREAEVNQLEIRGALTPTAQPVSVGFRHVLHLSDDPQALFSAFHPSQVQRNIRRAEREGVAVRRSTSPSDLLDLFYQLHVQTRRRLGVPVQPRAFFRLIGDQVLSRDLGFVVLASHGGRTVAGALFLAWNGTVIYKFGASEAAAWTVRPNHAIFWEAIHWGATNGFHTLDFGRTDFDTPGLRTFKLQWGTEEQPMVYSALGSPLRTGAGRASHLLGTLIRHSPKWVAQATGELLYRFAA